MARKLYTWEVTEKKQDPDGKVREFNAKRTGAKPPKHARNVRPAGQPKPEPEKPAAKKQTRAKS